MNLLLSVTFHCCIAVGNVISTAQVAVLRLHDASVILCTTVVRIKCNTRVRVHVADNEGLVQ